MRYFYPVLLHRDMMVDKHMTGPDGTYDPRIMPKAKAQRYFFDGQDRRANRDSESYFNDQFDAEPVSIAPGEYRVSCHAREMIVANIGHGIGLTVYESNLKIGGMAYVMLPEKALQSFPYFDGLEKNITDAMAGPMEACLRELQNMGAEEDKLRIRLIGASNTRSGDDDRGTKTYVFIKEYLVRKGLNIASEYIAGPHIRRVHYFPTTGRVVRRILRRETDKAGIEAEEKIFQDQF